MLSKSEMIAQSELAMANFLASGGSVTVLKAKAAPKQRMSGKESRAGSTGSGGFATGYASCNALGARYSSKNYEDTVVKT